MYYSVVYQNVKRILTYYYTTVFKNQLFQIFLNLVQYQTCRDNLCTKTVFQHDIF